MKLRKKKKKDESDQSF
jgi:hypothetical protein